ncbi:MAG: NADH-quinone oxidoreductase subunit H [Rhodobacteraceae bacterium]|nr:NADH-quinone oxidoreductase subunit H [Paracoccaceae bacterium]
MSAVLLILALTVGVYAVAVLEDWASHNRLRLLGPVISTLALLGQESVLHRKNDRLFFETAPILLLVGALLSLAIIPLAPGLIVTDLATGALFFNAALAYVLVALIMAGWGPDGAYGMIGGWRFLGQLIAYAMLVVMPITTVAMRAESLSTITIVESQAQLWNIVYQPLGFVLFAIAGMAMAFVPPFDLPNAEGELAGGVEAEYTGVRRMVFRLGRMVLILSVASATTVFYLGGWLGPWLPDWAWSAIKILAVTALMLAGGRMLPRVREGTLLAWAWKLGIPLALVNIFLVGVLVLVVPL